MEQIFKQDKGVAGLTILLSLIVMLFTIGLLIMIFTLMGGALRDSDTISAQLSATTTDTSITVVDASFTLTDCSGANQGTITTLSEVYNATVGAVSLANFTTSGCVVSIVAGGGAWNTTTYANATYTYSYAGSGYDVINDTGTSLAGVTDWFDIFIVIGAMVVLILLTVIIITAIRSSGMVAGGQQGANQVGTA